MKKTTPTADLGYPTEARGRIPAFHSVDEEAEFWDSHDSEELSDEFERADLSIGRHLAEKLTVRLDREDRDALVGRARRMGIGPSTLARMWIKEQLRRETSSR